MGLIKSITILAIIVVLLAGIAIVLSSHGSNAAPITKQQAIQQVLNDVNKNDPGVNATVVNNVSQSGLENDSWAIVVGLIYNSTKPCPSLSIEGFDYPPSLVPESYNTYTYYKRGNCVINGITGTPGENYVINSPYIAIARSFNESYSPIINYVYTNGYSNMVVHAKFYNILPINESGRQMNLSDVWRINYSATDSNSSLYVIMYINGSIVNSYNS
jgi:hypothetical protein